VPYSRDLDERIEEHTVGWTDTVRKKMFGGVCYLLGGNICFGIFMDYLIVRMSADMAEEMLKQRYVKAFDLTGRPMKGWIMVEKGSWSDENELSSWLHIGRSYALTLKKKPQRKKSLEEIYYRRFSDR